MRIFFGLLFGFLPILAPGQHHYSYELKLLEGESALEGSASITFYNHTELRLDTLYLHLPPRALEWRESFFQQQYTELQKIDLYFAKEEETGKIILPKVRAEGREIGLCKDCEFTPVPVSAAPGDSVEIRFNFRIDLPREKWLGTVHDPATIRIIDWLPQIPALDSSGFHLHPLTAQRDVYPSRDYYDIQLQLPGDLIVASNASLQSPKEVQRLEKLKKTAFAKLTADTASKTLHFKHFGTNLQFLISRQFNVFPLKGGGNLFTLRQDPFVPSIVDAVNDKIDRFFQNELGDDFITDFNLVLLENKETEYQSDHLLTLHYPGNAFELGRNLAEARMEALFRYRLAPDGFKNVWLARGIPYYYKYEFIHQHYPEEFWTPLQEMFTEAFWQPLAHSLAGWVLSLKDFDYAYQNQFLYLFLARQGLDQKMSAPADSLTRLNYEAVAKAKTFLALNHFRNYATEREFKRSMRDYVIQNLEKNASPARLKNNFQYYVNRDVDWFFDTWIHSPAIYNYRLTRTEYCPTVSTATVKNMGELDLPFSLTGIKDGDPVLTEWFPGHEGKESLQMYHEDYDKVVLNYDVHNPELNQRDNSYYDRFLLPRLDPFKFQFFQTFEDPTKNQWFWFPSADFNAYDNLLLGVEFYNDGLVARKWEYEIAPVYSTGQREITGYGSVVYNYLPPKTSRFHRISGGIFGRYFHYDEDLAYYRLSPGVTFHFRKPYPKSSILQQVRLRSVHVKRELGPEFEGLANEVSNASYSVLNLTHRFEETRLLRPYHIKTDFLLGNQFSRMSVETDFRWMLPNKRWLIWRGFGGVFFSNQFAEKGVDQNYYSLGLSGTQDFMFDYPFIGRSDVSGIWSRQFFVTDGGFKSETGVFADRWMLSTNLSVPVWTVFGVFGDVGLADNTDKIYYDYGFRIALLSDFLEFYLPVANQSTNFLREQDYFSHTRFVLNIDLDKILHRLRRGYY